MWRIYALLYKHPWYYMILYILDMSTWTKTCRNLVLKTPTKIDQHVADILKIVINVGKYRPTFVNIVATGLSILQILEFLRGAEECKSSRSQQILRKVCTCNIGFYTAENEPCNLIYLYIRLPQLLKYKYNIYGSLCCGLCSFLFSSQQKNCGMVI